MSETLTKSLKTDIRNLETLLFSDPLNIPGYQRPYKWTTKNVNQLIDDVLLHNDKTAYRLGTVVIHDNKETLDIVDGQQRLYTLNLIAAELLKTETGKRLHPKKTGALCLANTSISHPITKENLKRNHLLIQSRIKEFGDNNIEFFFQKCELVYIELKDISEAFQFFDSQNTRGKELEPHDLLKAFHLREMAANAESERISCVKHWEEVSDELPNIFGNYLFRVRRWSKGKSGLSFSKNNINTFKGISIEVSEQFNYINSYRINHYFIDQYNRDSVRNIDQKNMEYPFQLDQVMINGKRFFEFIYHYSGVILQIENIYRGKDKDISIIDHLNPDDKTAKLILHTLKTYKGKHRQGDLYVRNIFDCCLLYYIDKFGLYKLHEAIIKFFLWTYSLRLEKEAVQAVSADILARDGAGFFRIIREAVHPKEVLYKSIKPAKYVGIDRAVKNIKPILDIFRDLNALEN